MLFEDHTLYIIDVPPGIFANAFVTAKVLILVVLNDIVLLFYC